MIKKKIIFYSLFVLFSFTSTLYSIENKIIIKIDNEIITAIDIKNESKYLNVLNKNIENLDKEKIYRISKESIIREKIKKIIINKNFDNPDIQNEYLEKIFKSVYAKLNIKNLEDFKKYLKKQDVNFLSVKEKIKIEALWNELIFAKFSQKINIDEKKIRENVLKNKEKISKSYLMSEILFEVKNFNQIDEQYLKIKNAIDKEGFSNAALTFSKSNTSNLGGKLDWINENSLNKNILDKISNLEINEISDPVILPSGFLILKLNDVKKIKKEKDVEKEIKKIIFLKKNEQLNQFSKMYFNKVKKNIQINEL
jgi:peptidyl-prolyl cis-trans isomerase SurA